jgi:glycosyltransferase involved in cell wall biosynthesis
MKFLMVHNDYGAPSGEEVQFDHIQELLESHGHTIQSFRRGSNEIPAMALGNIRAFCSGIYSPSSRRHVQQAIESFRPDLVLFKNLYPLISPAILPVCARAGVPLVMLVANYRLMCPNGLHMSRGKTCEKCLGGREYHCVLNNCEGNLFKSTGYALRNTVARVGGFFKKNVSAFVCASRFLRQRMIDAGFDAQKLHLIPNVVPEATAQSTVEAAGEPYVGYVGRISREKGVHVLLDAARRCPEIPFRLAGRVAGDFELPDPLPANVKLVGFLEDDALTRFYRDAALILSTSECFETFGMSVGEAMQHGRAVIVSRIGVFPEFVQDGVTGLLFQTGNAAELAAKVRELWGQPQRRAEMGRAAQAWAKREYSPDMYYSRLMNVCRAVVPAAAVVG